MSQTIKKAPQMLRARALHKLGILAIPANSNLRIVGEPEVTPFVHTPRCVECMGVRTLRREWQKWKHIESEFEKELTGSFAPIAENLKTIPIPIVLAATFSTGAIAVSHLSQPWYYKVVLGGLGCAFAVSSFHEIRDHMNLTEGRDRLRMAWNIAAGNADICQQELERRGRALCSHPRLGN